MRRRVFAIIGVLFLIIGAMISESSSIIPTIVMMAIGLILTVPTIVGEIKREFI